MRMLASSGRTVEGEAHEPTDEMRFFRRVPGSVKEVLGVSIEGSEGKSSFGSVFIVVLAPPEEIFTISPSCSSVTVPVPEKEFVISLKTAAGRTISPGAFIDPFTERLIPVSRFVAEKQIVSFSAEIAIPASAGSVDVFRSEKRPTIPTACISSFFSREIFIPPLLVMLIGGKLLCTAYFLVYFHSRHEITLLKTLRILGSYPHPYRRPERIPSYPSHYPHTYQGVFHRFYTPIPTGRVYPVSLSQAPHHRSSPGAPSRRSG